VRTNLIKLGIGAVSLTAFSQTGRTAPDSGGQPGQPTDPDLRIRILAYWMDGWHWSTDQTAADSSSDSNASIRQANRLHPDDHGYQVERTATSWLPSTDKDEVGGSSPPRPTSQSPRPAGEFPRELESSRGEALQGCVCWRSPRGFSTRAVLHSGIANEYAGECLT
jgi:hypothetical protein